MLLPVKIKISTDGVPVAYSPITRMGNSRARHTRRVSCVLFIVFPYAAAMMVNGVWSITNPLESLLARPFANRPTITPLGSVNLRSDSSPLITLRPM